MEKANIILTGNYIFTAESTSYFRGSVVIKGECILAVLKEGESYAPYVDENTQIIDCGDKMVMPGMIDAHVHFLLTALCNSPCAVLMYDCKSEQECVDMCVEFRKKNPDVDRIYGFGWLNTLWGENGAPFPTRHSLDAAISDIPVYLESMDGHNFWLNSKALEECGYTKESTVIFGKVGLDEKGELSGMLFDLEASTIAMNNGCILPSNKLKKITLDYMKRMSSFGITAMGDVTGNTYPTGEYGEYAAYDELNREMEGGLPVRMFLYPSMGRDGDFTIVNALREKYQDPKVRIAGLKQFVDGVAVSHTAYTLEPYTDAPEIVSKPFFPKEVLRDVVTKANKAGYSVRMHAISDGSARLGLDVYEAAQKESGAVGITNTLEHLDNLNPEDIRRFGELGVIPSMQPAHMSLTATYFMENLGEKRAKLAYMHRALLDAGATLAFGTDDPCAPLNPYETIYYAITRCDFSGKPLTKNPEQAVTLGETLRAYTYGAACAVNASEELGTLTAGKYADIAVVDGPLFGEQPQEILKRRAAMTISAGKIVYQK